MTTTLADKEQPLLLPFGLHFRQTPAPLPALKTGQTTSEPEVTSGDGNDPDKIDSIWYPDEDEEPDDPPDDPPKKVQKA